MTLETEDLLQSILDSLDRIDYIRPDDIPDIELYMDQVTTFMDSRLKNAARNPEVDKILTKTMINNYAKNDLLPPPVRKKYSREHMLLHYFNLFPLETKHLVIDRFKLQPFVSGKETVGNRF